MDESAGTPGDAATDPAAAIAALMDSARAAIGGADPAAAQQGPFTGEADEARVVAEVSAQGRLTSLTLDPTLARRPLADIADDIVLAVNAALDARPARPDTGPLLDRLREVQEESVQRMGQISAAFTDALARAQRP